MANERLVIASQFVAKLRHCRAVEQRISVEQLAQCMVEAGFPVARYRYAPRPVASDPVAGAAISSGGPVAGPHATDAEWLASQLDASEQTGDVSVFTRTPDDTNTFIDALALCLPRVRLASLRLRFAMGLDDLGRHRLDQFGFL